MGKKACFAVVSILPTLPVDILIGLDIISTHQDLKAIYEQFKRVMDNFSMDEAQNGSQVDDKDREESSQAESEQVDRNAGQISMIQQPKRQELLQRLVDDESKP